MKVEKEVLIFRSEKELNEYVIKLVRPTSQVAVEDGEGAKYPATVDVIHTYGRKYDNHRIIFRKPGSGLINWFKQSNRWKTFALRLLGSPYRRIRLHMWCSRRDGVQR